ncbi:MAG: hypothetical protein A2599_03360 [Candidatus Staskawiczbacteria bacterium RIFOXYD1_FULL_39_28]|uniref:ATP synthase F1 complex delta/epsilon subunit N-terminal domain-containing protein n=1 Tax=Candidatus Staskawiczbacteria bacterium RIFOXYC1_FULL_38_18 TaxID=1802229 RepID=A0A1G2JB68_9BACT|nr:MAG: hypothetical protein A2401_03660 [Candidatus Staskawiczbacteria bacterium RIFOXYC1_FULL_38_18]OGZ90330.1 MAG: hypothetical protein A2599_03360 [Candidatus Staskawiczbacteria bacterium RIFOXYD1_FULL_39_28]
MKLSIYSLKNILFQGEAQLLNCKTPSGEITILDNHEPLISSLSAGPMKVVAKDGMEHLFPVKSGFMEVKPGNEVRCIVQE